MENKSIKNIAPRVLCVILDGFGLRENTMQNAIASTETPNINYLFNHYPWMKMEAGGEKVGLPSGVAGNSEVGHLNLGAGRPVRQDLVRINEAVEKNLFFHLEPFQDLLKASLKNNVIHLMGLLSDGKVHSHWDHLKYIISLMKTHYPQLKISLHFFMDGRDTAQDKGITYLQEMEKIEGITISSLQGRSFGMDRDRRWEKIELGLNALTGKSKWSALKPSDYVQQSYQNKIFDEFIEPVFFERALPIKQGDAVFFFNFRPDRARQITLALNEPNFSPFKQEIKLGHFLCMTPYVQEELPELPILFDKEKIEFPLSEYLSQLKIKQLKLAETEKYAHVTYFFNGGETKPFPLEEQILIPSPREVATYDLKPEMSADQVCQTLLDKLNDHGIGFYLVNFANSDMVGHTGNFKAACSAIEKLDECLGKIINAIESQQDISLIVVADHGNADQMAYPDGANHTSHTNSLVPFVVMHPKLKNQKMNLTSDFSEKNLPALKDVASTILYLMGLEKPKQFEGQPLYL